jgi:hypothetical protein
MTVYGHFGLHPQNLPDSWRILLPREPPDLLLFEGQKKQTMASRRSATASSSAPHLDGVQHPSPKDIAWRV